MSEKIFGYARVSTSHQKLKRQRDNILSVYPNAKMYEEAFTGTKMTRPEWSRLMKQVRSGDTIVFDEVSRMSRDAEEGYKTYEDLYNKGINLVFLKESTLNTENFRQTQQIATTGVDIADVYIEATNKVLMMLAEKQIKKAFETAEHEVEFIHLRTSEGVRKAQEAGKIVGREKGTKVTTKKSVDTKELIKKHSKDFGGSLSDAEVIKIAGISRNSYYKYKRELKYEA